MRSATPAKVWPFVTSQSTSAITSATCRSRRGRRPLPLSSISHVRIGIQQRVRRCYMRRVKPCNGATAHADGGRVLRGAHALDAPLEAVANHIEDELVVSPV